MNNTDIKTDIETLQSHLESQGYWADHIPALYFQERYIISEDEAYIRADEVLKNNEDEEEKANFWAWYEEKYYLPGIVKFPHIEATEETQEGLTALPEQVSKLEGDTEGGILKNESEVLKALENILREWKEDLSERELLDDLPDGSWKDAIQEAERVIQKATGKQ